MENKALQVETAKEWESLRLNTLDTYDKFKKELTLYNNVDDIFSDTSRVKIKKDALKYIFTIDNQNKFLIDENNLESWLQKFYEDKKTKEKRDTEESVLIKIKWLEIVYLKSRTTEELNTLQKEILAAKNTLEKSSDLENVKHKIERLVTFFEQEEQLSNERKGTIFGSQYDRKDRGLRKMQKTEIQRRLKELDKMKTQIERLEKNKDANYTIDRDKGNNEFKGLKEVKMDDINKFDMKTTLMQFSKRIEELGKEAPEFIKTRNEIILEKGDTTPYYEYVINNVDDAKRLNKALKRINKEYVLLDKVALSQDKRQALQQDLKRLSEYLDNYMNNPNTFDPAKTPFVPTETGAFNELCSLDPELKILKQLNKKAEKTTDGTNNPTYPEGKKEQTQWAETKKDQIEPTTADYNNAKTAFEKWGINGVSRYLVDQTHMRPEQKQFRSGVGNLALTGWLIFVGWKMISSAFKLMSKNGRKEGELGKNLARLGIPTLLIFWSQARTGEWVGSLFSWWVLSGKIANMLSRGSKDVNEKGKTTKTEAGTTYSEWFPWATAVFNGLTYGEMKQFIKKDGDTMKINPDHYQILVDQFKTGSKKNEAGAAFLESIGKNDKKNIIDLALGGMGITREQLQDNSNKDKKFNETASEAIVRLQSVSQFMTEKWYNKMNPETLPLVQKYIANEKGAYDLDGLEKRGDVFYKETEIADKTGLKDKIKEIAKGDKQKEEDLLLAINTFYEQMPSANKKIEITGTRPTIEFKTYNQASSIDLGHKELIGFTAKGFDTYAEAFKAANLTNRIKDICKDKTAKSDKPFYLSPAWRDITFDEATIFSTSFDTEIMTAGWGGSLEKVSPILEEKKQEYCDYLNSLNFWTKTANKTAKK